MTSLIETLIGVDETLGSYTFSADEIIRFARRYDPQRFHVDPEAARHSNFGALCASGWHTVAVWMKLNVASRKRVSDAAEARGEALPVFGPSPGFENLKWLKPVFAGDTIRYTRKLTGMRPLESRPGWSMMSFECAGYNQNDECVMQFDGRAMISLPA